MSMLSAQCDELRERAKTLGQGRWSDGADDARLMEDAADIIEGLESENAKLRELALTLAFCANDEADCDQCPMNGARCDTVQQCFCDGAATALCELGVEVDW